MPREWLIPMRQNTNESHILRTAGLVFPLEHSMSRSDLCNFFTFMSTKQGAKNPEAKGRSFQEPCIVWQGSAGSAGHLET